VPRRRQLGGTDRGAARTRHAEVFECPGALGTFTDPLGKSKTHSLALRATMNAPGLPGISFRFGVSRRGLVPPLFRPARGGDAAAGGPEQGKGAGRAACVVGNGSPHGASPWHPTGIADGSR